MLTHITMICIALYVNRESFKKRSSEIPLHPKPIPQAALEKCGWTEINPITQICHARNTELLTILYKHTAHNS